MNPYDQAKILVGRSDEAFARGDIDDGIALLQHAIPLLEQLDDPHVLIFICQATAERCLQNGYFAEARDFATAARTHLRLSPEDFQRPLLMNLVFSGQAHAELGEFDAAIACLLEAEPLARIEFEDRQLAGFFVQLVTAYVEHQEPGPALPYLFESLEMHQAHGDIGVIAIHHGMIAECMEATGQIEEAVDHYSTAVELFAMLGQRRHSAEYARKAGALLRGNQQHDRALPYLERALDILLEVGSPLERAECLELTVNCLHDMRQFRRALELSDLLMAIPEASESHDDRARLLVNRANILAANTRIDDARTAHMAAIDICERIGPPTALALCLMNYASYSGTLGHRDLALALNKRATSIYRQHGTPVDLADCLMNTAVSEWALDEYDAAIAMNREALALFRRYGLPMDLSIGLGRTANHLMYVGQYRECLEMAEEATILARQYGQVWDVARALQDQANYLDELNRSAEALPIYDDAISLLRQLDETEELARSLALKAAAHMRLRQYPEQFAILEEASRLLEGHQGAVADRVSIHFQLADVFLMMGLTPAAEYPLKQAAALLPELPDDNGFTRTFFHHSFANYHWRSGDLERARLHIETAMMLIEQRVSLTRQHVNRTEMRARHMMTFQLGIRIAVDLKDPEETFAIAQRIKGRTLTELLESRGEYSELDRRELLLTQQFEQGFISQDAYTTGIQHLQQQRDSMRQAQLGTDPRQPVPLGSIASVLHPGEALIDTVNIDNDGTLVCFLVLPDQQSVTWMYTVAGDRLSELFLDWHKLHKEYVDTLRRYAESPATVNDGEKQQARFKILSAKCSGLARTESRLLLQLGDLLFGEIAPLLDQHGVTTLIISPSGVLHRLPLAALRLTGSDRTVSYLIERFAMQLIPTASSLAIVRQNQNARITWPPTLLAAAPFCLDDDSPLASDSGPQLKHLVRDAETRRALPLSRKEIASAAAVLGKLSGPGYPPITLYRDAATRSSVLEHLPTARILHLSTHGAAVEQRNVILDYQIFLFGDTTDPDNVIAVNDIYNGIIPLKDVFAVLLSACTVGNVLLHGAEAIGFAQGFLQAGAGVIIAPVWAVDDRATSELVARWYGLLASVARPTVARAWQLAILDFRKNPAHSLHTHPFFWAGFLPNGDGALSLGQAPSP